MITDLFLAGAGFDFSTLPRVAPPACLRGVDTVAPRHDGDDVVIDCPVWTPRRAAAHLLPALSPLAPVPPAFRFELSACTDGAWSPWIATVTLGAAEFSALPSAAGPLTCEVDEVRASSPVNAVRLRIRCRGPLPAAWLASLSAASADDVGSSQAAADAVRLRVPRLTQTGEDPAIALRICSPTSVAMVLGYWDRPATAAAVAHAVFHSATDLYGIWPAAIRAAAARGVAGYLLRFPDWPTAEWCLARRIPIIASIRYGAGELAGAAIPATSGHLVVLRGYENGTVLVNDPAAPTLDTVARAYRRDEFVRAWLEHSGVGYVLFDPTRV